MENGELALIKFIVLQTVGFYLVLKSVYHVGVLELNWHGIIIDDWKKGDLPWKSFNNSLVGGRFDRRNMLIQTVFLQYFHFSLKHILVVKPEQLFVGEVNVKLFETVELKILEPKNVKDVDGKILWEIFGSQWSEWCLNFVYYKFEYWVIDCFA